MKNGNYRYAVLMTVPLGERNGELDITIRESTVFGSLTMFTVTLPIQQGSCSGNQISFSGDMKTLLDLFPYEAAGTISRSQLDLTFHTGRGDFHASGRRKNGPKYLG